MGVSVASTLNYYSETDPTAVRQAFGATALFVGGLGSVGYAIRRDLSFLYRALFWLLLVLAAGNFRLSRRSTSSPAGVRRVVRLVSSTGAADAGGTRSGRFDRDRLG